MQVKAIPLKVVSRLIPRLGRDLPLLLAGGLLLLLLVAAAESAGDRPWLGALLQLARLPLGLAYILFVPGYCLTAALFPARDDLDGIERTGLSLGLSVAWVSILALILDWLPWGLRLWPILWGELLSILLFSAVAAWRRGRLEPGAAYAPALAWRPRPWWATLSAYERRIYKLCAGALLLAALSAAWVFLVPSPATFMTEFYILGKEGLAEDYPRQAAPGETLSVTLGIHNLERRPHTYRVEVWAVDPWSGRQEPVQTAGPFTLAREEGLERPLTWQMPWPGQDQQVTFLLFLDEQPEPYRQLRLWLNVVEAR
jgi:uncharacterized membrane protein